MNDAATQPIIVMGASSGGVKAIFELAAMLPRDFPAPILFVQHIGAHPSELSRLVSARGPNPALAAADGDVPRPGTIHIAPPDQHMLLDGPVIRLSCGPRAIGVVLTGMLDDGSAGLRAIKGCGGTAVVQDPADAHAPSMPRCALACVEADHVVPLAALGPLLYSLASRAVLASAAGRPEPPATLQQEHAISHGSNAMQTLTAIASPWSLPAPTAAANLFKKLALAGFLQAEELRSKAACFMVCIFSDWACSIHTYE